MKISKEIRQLARHLARESCVEGALDRGRVESIVQAIGKKKPRNYVQLLETYQRLLRLEADKRRARIESATALEKQASQSIVRDLEKKYGVGLTTEYVVNPALLGGVRIRVGNDVWDSSVRNRLDRLQQKF